MCPAYALREEYTGTVDIDGNQVPKYAGGIIATPRGDFDVRQQLDDGDGTIVIDDTDEVLAGHLDAYPALKRVKAPQPVTADQGYDNFTVADLRREAKSRGLEDTGQKKADLVAALEANDKQAEEANGAERETA